MAEEGHLPPRDVGWTETLAPMEHGAPSEIPSGRDNVKDDDEPPISLFI